MSIQLAKSQRSKIHTQQWRTHVRPEVSEQRLENLERRPSKGKVGGIEGHERIHGHEGGKEIDEENNKPGLEGWKGGQRRGIY